MMFASPIFPVFTKLRLFRFPRSQAAEESGNTETLQVHKAGRTVLFARACSRARPHVWPPPHNVAPLREGSTLGSSPIIGQEAASRSDPRPHARAPSHGVAWIHGAVDCWSRTHGAATNRRWTVRSRHCLKVARIHWFGLSEHQLQGVGIKEPQG